MKASRFGAQLASAVVFNISLRLFTFILSTLLTRSLLPSQAGINFSYQVYVDAILFISREAARNVASRYSVRVESASPAWKLHCVKLAALINTAALSIPLCVFTVASVEGLGGAVPQLYQHYFPSDSPGAGPLSVVPTLSRRLWSVYASPQFREFSVGLHWSSRAISCLLVALPEMMVWSSIFIMLLVEPSIALLSSLDGFRSIVIGECLSMIVRLSSTLVLAKMFLVQREEPVRQYTSGILHAVVNPEWNSRIVFGAGLLIHSLATIVYHLIACSGPSSCRWWCGTGSLQAPLPAELHDVLDQKNGSKIFYLASKTGTEGITDVKDGRKGKGAALDRGGALPLPLLGSVFPFSIVRRSLMQQAQRYHQHLLSVFYREAVIRVVLSEGTNMALFSVADAASRGCYQTVTRLGALATRLVFRIWESACQSQWSRLAHEGCEAEALQSLVSMMRLSFYVGFACSWLGPLYAKMVLTLLYSGRWTSPRMVAALQYYCHGMGPMAWNGLLECFVRAVGGPVLLKRQQLCNVVVSVLYVVCSYATLMRLHGGEMASDYSQQKSCEETSAMDALLVLHRYNMVARVVISVVLLLCSRSENKLKETSDGGESPSSSSSGTGGGETSSSSRPSRRTLPRRRIISYRNALDFLPRTWFVLLLLFIWTRTPVVFPAAWAESLLFPPLLSLLLLGVMVGGEPEMRAAVLSVMGRRFSKKTKVE